MSPVLTRGAVTVDLRLTPDDLASTLRRDVRAGLARRPRTLSPVWFYDDRGCDLYAQITRLPEYYPFRTEQRLLRRTGAQIVEVAGASVLVEIGSGNSEKTRELLTAMAGSSAGLEGYVPFDVAAGTLQAAATHIADDMGIAVHAVVGDFHEHLDAIPRLGPSQLVAFLGSTIGNLTPGERKRFLAAIAGVLRPADRFLLATDLVKPVDRLVAAYDDAAGVTAAFDLNVLNVLNRELGADFDPARFSHVAEWNGEERWIEMRLRAQAAMRVDLPALDMMIDFDEGDDIRTEISAKFTPSQVSAELADVGLEAVGLWTDPAGDYLLTLARPGGR